MTPPEHALNRKNRSQQFTKYIEKHPDTITITASNLYEITWRYFSNRYNLECLPPPLIVNHTSQYPKINDDFYTVMMFNTAYASVERGDFYGLTDVYKNVLPHIHEIQFYTRAFRRSIRDHFDNRLNLYTINLFIIHYYIHELHHFMDHLNETVAMQKAYYADKDKMGELIQKHCQQNHELYESSDAESARNRMEWENEQRALESFEDFIRNFLYGDDLGYQYGSEAWEFLVRRKANYAEALTVLEYTKAEAKSIYDDLSDTERTDIDDQLEKLTMQLASFNDYKKTRFVIVD